jgi:hypothetical protein
MNFCDLSMISFVFILFTGAKTVNGSCDRLSYRIQQGLVLKRLMQEVDSAPFHRLNTHRDVAVPGHKYYLLDPAGFRQVPLECETIEPGQKHIKN